MQPISIIIPTLNEEKNVSVLLERIHHALNGYRYEVIVIDDHSTDKTVHVLKQLSKKFPVTTYPKKGNPGKAYSLLEGFDIARNDLFCIIDADLQYPPEVIPEMMKKIMSGDDIVVADRKQYNGEVTRKIISKSFRFLFGKLMHGLEVDVQSGLKVFRKNVITAVSLRPSPWTFDLELLVKARAQGFRIGSHPIIFSPRKSGTAKINSIPASFEVGINAVKLKLSPVNQTKPIRNNSDGSFTYNGKQFTSFTKLPHAESALISITPTQRNIFIGLGAMLLIGFLINWHVTIILVVSILTTLYFIDLLFNLFLIHRSFTKNPEIKVTDREIDAIPEYAWPKYTVFCPLYKEWEVLPQFISAMSRLDYPKEKLQVMLLLEEDDKETVREVQKMTLPSYFDTIIVPDSQPKTKPKALNYGLTKATGEYVVIYDAEDIPDPLQLKKSVLSFRKAGKRTVCIQAKLNFYNPEQNMLTRLFTAEYSLWFDMVLTGLQSIKAPIPLGGTSNHFRAKDLLELNGWDAFNVTEDCDLGTRLTKKGYYTAMFDSTTLEEANSDLKNWYQQRSRWIKGYIQTYLVHMRNPSSFFNNTKEPHFIIFQFVIGGKILSLFINPLMWMITASYFLFRPWLGEIIESLYITPVFYMGVFSLIVGNFLYVYYYMIGCAKREQEELIPYILLVPFYWLAMSVASWKALYEIIYKPHYWSKTRHGLHLKNMQPAQKGSQSTSLPLPVSPAYFKN